jgi:hypothetical protein
VGCLGDDRARNRERTVKGGRRLGAFLGTRDLVRTFGCCCVRVGDPTTVQYEGDCRCMRGIYM